MNKSKTAKWKLAQNIELRWWKNYLNGKDVAQYHQWKKNYWQGLLDKISPSLMLDANTRVLDAGCGPAGMYMVLPDCKVDAVDPLLDGYEDSLPHFKKSFYPNTTFYSVPLEDFEVNEKYDVVFCMNAINHVSDLEGCYNKICDAVKPGGQLIVTIDAHNFSFFKNLFRLVPGDVLHPHQYDLAEYEQFLTDRKLQLQQTVLLKKEFFFNHYLQVAQGVF